MKFTITGDIADRIEQGISEAQRQIDRELMKYTGAHRDTALIAQCEAHIAKMREALRSGVLVAGE
jgi:hypothetical protein